MQQQNFVSLFAAARFAGVPILIVRTADQHATAAAILEHNGEFPILRWDCVTGLQPISDKHKPSVEAVRQSGVKPDETVDVVSAMAAAKLLPPKSILIACNMQRQLQSAEPGATAAAIQSVANLREPFKRNFRMLVCPVPYLAVPPELDQDVVVIDHELPDVAELRRLVEEVHASAESNIKGMPKLTDEQKGRAVDAVSGLSLFAAENVHAMSYPAGADLKPEERGLDLSAMWERKRVAIENTPGLSVYRGTETFRDLRGLDSIKTRLAQHKTARTPVGVVVWIDEGSDVFANVETDTSGTKTDQQRGLLVEMEQNGWRGIIGVGVPGTGKSALCRAFGNEAGVPTIQIDFGAMESKYIGESEGNLRQALKVIKAIGRGHAFFMLTANSLRGIRPQFQARFRRGIFFFDMPSREEKDAIWTLYLDRYQIRVGKDNPRPDDDGWVAREIRECCESAWDCGITLREAARFIVPTSLSRAQEIEAMRQEAHGRFLDASKPGTYQYEGKAMERQVAAVALPKGVRRIGDPSVN